MEHIDILVKTEEGITLPTYATSEAAGADVRAYLMEPLTIAPGKRALIPTGIKMVIPPGYEVQVRPRSGLALKHGISIPNTPGTIDSDYRGDVGVILINHGDTPFVVEPNMRIAQLVVAPVVQANFKTGELTASKRGDGGFGSSGVN